VLNYDGREYGERNKKRRDRRKKQTAALKRMTKRGATNPPMRNIWERRATPERNSKRREENGKPAIPKKEKCREKEVY